MVKTLEQPKQLRFSFAIFACLRAAHRQARTLQLRAKRLTLLILYVKVYLLFSGLLFFLTTLSKPIKIIGKSSAGYGT
jgi:hypothetical protein